MGGFFTAQKNWNDCRETDVSVLYLYTETEKG